VNVIGKVPAAAGAEKVIACGVFTDRLKGEAGDEVMPSGAPEIDT
jgi:hypothetical protein